MAKSIEQPISNFASRKLNYPLLIAGGFVLLCLAAGLVAALMAGARSVAGFFAGGMIGAGVLIFLSFRHSYKATIGQKNEAMRWETALPDVQRQDLNIEISELGRILEVGDDQMGDLLSAYIVAEDLALRQIQHEETLPVLRHVTIAKAPFDGVVVKQDLITCISVTFLVTPEIRQEKVDSVMRKMAAVKKALNDARSEATLRLLLVLVTQLSREDEARLRSSLAGRFASTTVDIDIRLLDFETLQRTYAINH
jgi:hypothetical protein